MLESKFVYCHYNYALPSRELELEASKKGLEYSAIYEIAYNMKIYLIHAH